MPLVDAREQALADGVLVPDAAYTADATVYMGMSTTTPTDAGGNVTEPVGNGYARQAITAATLGAATGTAPAAKLNTSALTYAQATGSWGTLTHAVFYDALTVGNIRAWGALAASQAIVNGDTLQVPVGSLAIKVGKPTDSY